MRIENEKAPDGLPSDQSASEINQVQNTPDFGNCQEPVDPVILELIAINRRLNEIYRSHNVISVGSCGDARIQIWGGTDSFFNLFSFAEYEEVFTNVNGFIRKEDRYSVTVDGIEFFCLVEKEPRINV